MAKVEPSILNFAGVDGRYDSRIAKRLYRLSPCSITSARTIGKRIRSVRTSPRIYSVVVPRIRTAASDMQFGDVPGCPVCAAPQLARPKSNWISNYASV